MPTLNEAAEMLRLRAALDNIALEAKAIEAGYLPEDLTAAIDAAESALAADPGPLVAALGEVVHAAYEVVGSVRARQAVFANAPPSRVAVDRLDSALAAYRAALNVEVGRG